MVDDNELPAPRRETHYDREQARAAARNPKRPGEKCKAPPGDYVVTVDRRRCEGKSDCVAVCPYDVFAVRTIDEAEFRALPIFLRLKSWVHGKKAAYAVHADACQACGLCVVACPEKAITLVKRSGSAAAP